MKKAIATALAAVIICLTTACSGQGAAAPQGSAPADGAKEAAGAQQGAAEPAGDAKEAQEGSAAGGDDAAQGGSAAGVDDAAQGDTASEAAAGSTAREAASEFAVPERDAAVRGDGFYENEKGWTVWYDPQKFVVRERGEEDVIFRYTGEATGENYAEIRFVPEGQPQEVLTKELEQLVEETDIDPLSILRDEGFFFEDKWAFTAEAEYGDGERDVTASFQSAEYNGGVILTKVVSGMTDESILEGFMNDKLWGILGSLSFYHYEPQEEYSYVPGTYTRAGSEEGAVDAVILKEGHTGYLESGDRIPVYWGSWKITKQFSEDAYEYTIEGDALYLKEKDSEDWIEYNRTAGPDGTREEGLLLNQDYVNALNKEIDFLYHDTSFLNLEYGMDRKSGAIRLYLSKEG